MQGERNFTRFGGWLGKNSTFGKNTRLLEDVHVHLLASRICEPTRYLEDGLLICYHLGPLFESMFITEGVESLQTYSFHYLY